MDKIFPVPSHYILIKDMSETLDFSLIEKIIEEENTLIPNLANKISKTKTLFDNPSLENMKNILAKECEEFVRGTYNEIQFEALKITNSWFNITKKGERHHMHIHPFSVVSGIIYLDDNPDNLSTMFTFNIPPLPYYHQIGEKLLGCTVDSFYNNYNIKNEDNHNNLKHHLVLFLSSVYHEVLEIQGENDRRTISFNTFWTGTTGGHCNPEEEPDPEKHLDVIKFL